MNDRANDNGTPEGSARADEMARYIRTGDPRPLIRIRAELKKRGELDEHESAALRTLDALLSAEPLSRISSADD